MNSFDPITEGFGSAPVAVPLGQKFKHRVSIHDVDHRTCELVCRAHHTYMPYARKNLTPVRHGIFLDECLAGVISYSEPMASEPINGISRKHYFEVSRVAIGVDFPNLASCGMAKSQKIFIDEFAQANDIKMLITYVRDDYEGSMFEALSGLGWEYDKDSKGHQPGNKPSREIYDYDKKRYVCMVNV